MPGVVEELINEHGKMIFNAQPIKLIEKNNRLTALELIKTKLVKKKGTYRLEDIKGSSFKINTDHIILAIGQQQHLTLGKNKRNNIYSVGDFATGATTLINAIAHAKDVVKRVDKFLMKRDLFKSDLKVTDIKTTGRRLDLNYIPIQEMPTINLNQRTFGREVDSWHFLYRNII